MPRVAVSWPQNKKGRDMTWTIYNNDKAWGFLSEVEQRAIREHEGVMKAYDFASGMWCNIYRMQAIEGHVYRAAPEPTTAVATNQSAQLDTANARIAELEVALRDALASCSHDIPEYHEQGMCCGLEDRNITDRYEAMSFGWEQAMERAESEIISNTQEILTAALNPTTEEAPCSQRS
jgi:hypothetical protein